MTDFAPPRLHRANIDLQDEGGASALHHAAKSGTVKTIKLLLVAGAERRCHDRDQKTPMDWAEEAKRPHSLEALRVYTAVPITETEYVDFAGRHFGIDIFDGETGSFVSMDDSSVLTAMSALDSLSRDDASMAPSIATIDEGGGLGLGLEVGDGLSEGASEEALEAELMMRMAVNKKSVNRKTMVKQKAPRGETR